MEPNNSPTWKMLKTRFSSLDYTLSAVSLNHWTVPIKEHWDNFRSSPNRDKEGHPSANAELPSLGPSMSNCDLFKDILQSVTKRLSLQHQQNNSALNDDNHKLICHALLRPQQTDNSYYSIPDSESGCVPETLDGVRKHEQKTCDAVERKLNTTTVKDMTQGRIFNVKKKEQKTSVFNPITRNSLNSKWDLITLQYNTDISLLFKFIATKNELYFHSSAIIAGIISMAVNLVAHFGWSRLMQSRVKKDR